ncbi:MAG: SagB/ThcOx family dehydrogenase [Pseudomonadota bacterium]|nr:SagB/ThcOx family dehydrogenase [Pseudomonadota bacterium]
MSDGSPVFSELRAEHPLGRMLEYHDRTKHRLNRFARSPGYLDWATQPDPFRRFGGTTAIALEHPAPTLAGPRYDDLFDTSPPADPVDIHSLSRFLYDSLALSAWKEAAPGNRWSLRVNPSSGDLHPTEAYLLIGYGSGIDKESALFHYNVFDHALEKRRGLGQVSLSPTADGGFFVGFSSIYWRESWKYGERAFRYCHHDVGHALGGVAISAALSGWRTRLVSNVSDGGLDRLLGCHLQSGPEAEHADCLIAVFPVDARPGALDIQVPAGVADDKAREAFIGRPNPLSGNHRDWPVIEEAGRTARNPGAAFPARPVRTGDAGRSASRNPRDIRARPLIRTRRSAVALDAVTHLGAEPFFRMLERLMPDTSPIPFDILPYDTRISLVLFVHRVRGLDPGIYALVRDLRHMDSLRSEMTDSFAWRQPPGCPPDLPLYLLETGDARQVSALVSCRQEIAGDGAFSLGMLAELEAALETGAWAYPRCYWEAGLIGQVLYLEAEAAGVRGTGIGCFFDDAVHQLLGISNHVWQSIYHFTVGGAVEDTRLRTLHPYFHLGY